MNSLLPIILIILLLYLLINTLYKEREGLDFLKKLNPFAAIFAAGRRLINAMSSIPNEISGVANDISSLGGKIANGFTDTMAKTASGLKEIEKLPQIGEELSGMIKDMTDNAGDDLKNFGEKSMGNVGNFVTKDLGGVVDDIGSSFVKLGEIVSEFFKWIFEQIKDVLYMLASVFEDFFNMVKNAFLDFFNIIGEVFMSVTDFFYDIIKVLMELPGCVPYYAADTSIAIGKTVLPSGLKSFIRWCFSWIINPLIYFWSHVLTLMGFNLNYVDGNKSKCYPNFMKTIGSLLTMGIDFIMDIINIIVGLF